jgi:hypothetical protein
MSAKDQNVPMKTDILNDLTIGFDNRPLTKKEQRMISAFIKKDKNKRRKNKITNA